MTDAQRWRYTTQVITTSASFSDSTTLHKVVCPAASLMVIICGSIDNDVASTISFDLRASSGERIGMVLSEASTASVKFFGNTLSSVNNIKSLGGIPLVLTAGEYLNCSWGTAQSTSVALVIKYAVVDA